MKNPAEQSAGFFTTTPTHRRWGGQSEGLTGGSVAKPLNPQFTSKRRSSHNPRPTMPPQHQQTALVPRHQPIDPTHLANRQQKIIERIGRTLYRWQCTRHLGRNSNLVEQPTGLKRADARPYFPATTDIPELVELNGMADQREPAAQPSLDQPTRYAIRCDQAAQQDIGVKNDAHNQRRCVAQNVFLVSASSSSTS